MTLRGSFSRSNVPRHRVLTGPSQDHPRAWPAKSLKSFPISGRNYERLPPHPPSRTKCKKTHDESCAGLQEFNSLNGAGMPRENCVFARLPSKRAPTMPPRSVDRCVKNAARIAKAAMQSRRIATIDQAVKSKRFDYSRHFGPLVRVTQCRSL